MKSSILTMFFRLILPFFLLCSTAAAANAAQLQKIQHKTLAAGSEEVVLSFNTVVEPKVFTMGGKQPRLVFDFEGVEPYRTLRDLNPGSALVKGVRLGIHRQGDVKTRLVFDVNSLQGLKHSYKVDEGNNRLVIRFTATGAAVAAKENPAQTAPTRLQAGAAKKKGTGKQETAAVDEKEAEKAATAPAPAVEKKEEVAQKAAAPARTRATKASEEKEAAAPVPTPSPAAPAEKTAAAPPAAPAPAASVASSNRTQPAAPATANSAPETPAAAAAPAASVAASQPAPAAAPAASTQTPYLSAIQFDPDSPRGELVQFKLNGFYPPVLRSIETGNPQVICEFTNLQVAPALEGPIKISGRFVKAIRLDKAADGGKVRVFVELEPNQSYDLQQVFFKEDNFFVLIVNTVKA